MEECISREDIRAALAARHSRPLQDRLDGAHVAVAGLGGLGSHVAVFLVRAGVGHLHLVDFDRVELTNLNRQNYLLRHVGMYKTDALLEQLKEINPYLDFRTDCVKVTERNLSELFAEDDIVCEAFDRPEAKAMLVCGVREHFPEKYLIAASGMAGYGGSNLIQTRQIGPHFYLCGDEVSEASEGRGLMAPRVAVCAGHEADLALRLIAEELSEENKQKRGKTT